MLKKLLVPKAVRATLTSTVFFHTNPFIQASVVCCSYLPVADIACSCASWHCFLHLIEQCFVPNWCEAFELWFVEERTEWRILDWCYHLFTSYLFSPCLSKRENTIPVKFCTTWTTAWMTSYQACTYNQWQHRLKELLDLEVLMMKHWNTPYT